MSRKQIKLVVSPGLYDQLSDKAKAEQLPISTYVRNLIVNSPEFTGQPYAAPVEGATVADQSLNLELQDLRSQIAGLRDLLLEQAATNAMASAIPAAEPELSQPDVEVLSLADVLRGAGQSVNVAEAAAPQPQPTQPAAQASAPTQNAAGKNITINLNL
jgi:hypothetical protein